MAEWHSIKKRETENVKRELSFFIRRMERVFPSKDTAYQKLHFQMLINAIMKDATKWVRKEIARLWRER